MPSLFRIPGILLLIGAFWLAACGGGQPAEETPAERSEAIGERVYNQQCITCHQADGKGVPGVYPPLRGTGWVTGDKGRLIRLVLDGMRGPIVVKGQQYDNVMTPHERLLNDEQIAAVLTYVRQHFGNDASPVTPDEVMAVREADRHEGLWDADELRDETGIPDTAE